MDRDMDRDRDRDRDRHRDRDRERQRQRQAQRQRQGQGQGQGQGQRQRQRQRERQRQRTAHGAWRQKQKQKQTETGDVIVNFFLVCSWKLCGAWFSWLCFNSKCISVALECDSLIFWQWKCQCAMCMFCLNAQSQMEVLSRCAREWQPFKFAAFVGHTLHLI